MLIGYFVRNFTRSSILFFSILTLILASCNLFVRLPFITHISSAPLLVITMLPLMAQFALPIATSLSVFSVISAHISNLELLILDFLSAARLSLYKAITLFSFLSCCAYAFLLFQLAPNSYQVGKKILLNMARDHILTLEPNKFHNPFPSCTVFFKQKTLIDDDAKVFFSPLFLVFMPKASKNNDEYYLFTAESGYFTQNCFVLNNGSLYTYARGHLHTATFVQTKINIARFINASEQLVSLTQPKFLPLMPLLERSSHEFAAWVELHKRIALVLWSFVQPWLIFFFASILSVWSLLMGIILSGLLYLLSYVFVTSAQIYVQGVTSAMLFFYVPVLSVFFTALYFFTKRRQN